MACHPASCVPHDGAVGAHHEDGSLVARLGRSAGLAQIPTAIPSRDIGYSCLVINLAADQYKVLPLGNRQRIAWAHFYIGRRVWPSADVRGNVDHQSPAGRMVAKRGEN